MKFRFILLYLIYAISIFSQNIYVVYDDSGSMKKDERWIYANYAIQNLVSMLSEEDKIFLVKMSDYKNDYKNTKKITNENLEAELFTLQKELKYQSKITPYSSVEYAINNMTNKFGKDEKNWIITITDGQFEDGESLGLSRIEDVKLSVKSLMEKTITKPIFFIIGSNQNDVEFMKRQEGIALWKEVLGEGDYPKIISSLGKEEIIEKISEIAYMITGKSQKETDVKLEINGKNIKMDIAIPLKRILVLEQSSEKESKNKIRNIKNQKTLSYDKSYKTEVDFNNIKLNSMITSIEASDKTSITGETIIEFENEVKNDIKIIYEANAKFNIKILDLNGNEIKNRFIEEYQGEKIKIQGQLLDGEKNEPLTNFSAIQMKIRYGKEEKQLKYNSDTKYYETDVLVESGTNSIDASAEFPGYFDFKSEIYTVSGMVIPPAPEGISREDWKNCFKNAERCPIATKPMDLKLEMVAVPENGILTQSNFETIKLIFKPSIDGRQLNTIDLKETKFDFDTKMPGKIITKQDKNDVVTFEFIPKAYIGISRFKNPKGEFFYKASLTRNEIDNSAELKGKIEVTMGSFLKVWGGLILTFILPAIIGLIVFGYVVKKKFNKNAEIVIEKKNEYETQPKKINLKLQGTTLDKLIPYRTYRNEISDKILYIADGKNAVKVQGKNIKQLFSSKMIKKLYINGDLIDREDKNFGVKDYRMFNGDGIEVHKDGKIEKYTYFYQKGKK